MNIGIYVLIGFILVPIGIGIAYYQDFKNNKKEFRSSVKSISKGLPKIFLIIALLGGGLYLTYKNIFPTKKNHGMEFNHKRKELGIPILDSNWVMDNENSNQFITYWRNNVVGTGHVEKKLEYGIINIRYETDLYHSPKMDGAKAWSRFDYLTNSSYYTVQVKNPNYNSSRDSRKYIFEQVNKSQFEQYTGKKTTGNRVNGSAIK